MKSVADLRGKKIGVTSYQEAGYYALLAVLNANGLKRGDMDIRAVGPAGMTQLMIAKALDATMTVLGWADQIEVAGVPLDYFRIDKFFPAMPQAILASERRSSNGRNSSLRRQDAVAGGRIASTTLRARPDFVAIVPRYSGREEMVERVLGATYRTSTDRSAVGTGQAGRGAIQGGPVVLPCQ